MPEKKWRNPLLFEVWPCVELVLSLTFSLFWASTNKFWFWASTNIFWFWVNTNKFWFWANTNIFWFWVNTSKFWFWASTNIFWFWASKYKFWFWASTNKFWFWASTNKIKTKSRNLLLLLKCDAAPLCNQDVCLHLKVSAQTKNPRLRFFWGIIEEPLGLE